MENFINLDSGRDFLSKKAGFLMAFGGSGILKKGESTWLRSSGSSTRLIVSGGLFWTTAPTDNFLRMRDLLSNEVVRLAAEVGTLALGVSVRVIGDRDLIGDAVAAGSAVVTRACNTGEAAEAGGDLCGHVTSSNPSTSSVVAFTGAIAGLVGDRIGDGCKMAFGGSDTFLRTRDFLWNEVDRLAAGVGMPPLGVLERVLGVPDAGAGVDRVTLACSTGEASEALGDFLCIGAGQALSLDRVAYRCGIGDTAFLEIGDFNASTGDLIGSALCNLVTGFALLVLCGGSRFSVDSSTSSSSSSSYSSSSMASTGHATRMNLIGPRIGVAVW